jgi:hypothetical protein
VLTPLLAKVFFYANKVMIAYIVSLTALSARHPSISPKIQKHGRQSFLFFCFFLGSYPRKLPSPKKKAYCGRRLSASPLSAPLTLRSFRKATQSVE